MLPTHTVACPASHGAEPAGRLVQMPKRHGPYTCGVEIFCLIRVTSIISNPNFRQSLAAFEAYLAEKQSDAHFDERVLEEQADRHVGHQ
jgi:hypothetical protein